jgi:mannose/fructose/N-acetylgalactosamine-specific phosphotransferase system component IIC
MMSHWLPVALLMAFLSLDETAVGQFMLSRPIVVGPLVGWLLGRADIGLEMGALIELIWIGDVPVGAHLPLDLMMLSGTAVALSCELVRNSNPEASMTFALGVAIPLAAMSTELEIALRKFHIRWLHFAQRMAYSGHMKTFEWLNYFVLAEQWLKGFLVAVVSLALAHLSGGLFYLLGGILDGKVIEGFYYAHWLLLALGCSAVIDLMVEKKTVIYLILTIVTMMSLAVFSPLQGVHLVAIALIAGFVVALFFVGKGEAAG